jgi:transposase
MTTIYKYMRRFRATGLCIDKKRTRGRRLDEEKLEDFRDMLETSPSKFLVRFAQQEGVFALLPRSAVELLHCQPHETAAVHRQYEADREARVNYGKWYLLVVLNGEIHPTVAAFDNEAFFNLSGCVNAQTKQRSHVGP